MEIAENVFVSKKAFFNIKGKKKMRYTKTLGGDGDRDSAVDLYQSSFSITKR